MGIVWVKLRQGRRLRDPGLRRQCQVRKEVSRTRFLFAAEHVDKEMMLPSRIQNLEHLSCLELDSRHLRTACRLICSSQHILALEDTSAGLAKSRFGLLASSYPWKARWVYFSFHTSIACLCSPYSWSQYGVGSKRSVTPAETDAIQWCKSPHYTCEQP